jgi:hypothetical protein
LNTKVLFVFFIIYYLLLILLGVLMGYYPLTILYFLFVIFSFLDVILLNKLFIKYKLIFIPYIILSYLLCVYINGIIDQFRGWGLSLIKAIISSSHIFINSLNNYIYDILLFFIPFILIKIIPCIISIIYINKNIFYPTT